MINQVVKTFRDLNNLIDIHQTMYDAAEKNMNYYYELLNTGCPRDIGAMTYDGMPKSTTVIISMDRIVDMIHKYTELMENEHNNIERLRSSKVAILDSITLLEGVTYKVASMRIIEGKRLDVIAVELNISLAYAKKISAGIGR